MFCLACAHTIHWKYIKSLFSLHLHLKSQPFSSCILNMNIFCFGMKCNYHLGERKKKTIFISLYYNYRSLLFLRPLTNCLQACSTCVFHLDAGLLIGFAISTVLSTRQTIPTHTFLMFKSQISGISYLERLSQKSNFSHNTTIYQMCFFFQVAY